MDKFQSRIKAVLESLDVEAVRYALERAGSSSWW